MLTASPGPHHPSAWHTPVGMWSTARFPGTAGLLSLYQATASVCLSGRSARGSAPTERRL